MQAKSQPAPIAGPFTAPITGTSSDSNSRGRRWMPTSIALAIAYVGIENFFVKDGSKRWRITFPFGLLTRFLFDLPGFLGFCLSRTDSLLLTL